MLQLSPVLTTSPASTARRDITFEDALAQVHKDKDDDETLFDAICKDVIAVRAVVAKIVVAKNANNTDHV